MSFSTPISPRPAPITPESAANSPRRPGSSFTPAEGHASPSLRSPHEPLPRHPSLSYMQQRKSLIALQQQVEAVNSQTALERDSRSSEAQQRAVTLRTQLDAVRTHLVEEIAHRQRECSGVEQRYQDQLSVLIADLQKLTKSSTDFKSQFTRTVDETRGLLSQRMDAARQLASDLRLELEKAIRTRREDEAAAQAKWKTEVDFIKRFVEEEIGSLKTKASALQNKVDRIATQLEDQLKVMDQQYKHVEQVAKQVRDASDTHAAVPVKVEQERQRQQRLEQELRDSRHELRQLKAQVMREGELHTLKHMVQSELDTLAKDQRLQMENFQGEILSTLEELRSSIDIERQQRQAHEADMVQQLMGAIRKVQDGLVTETSRKLRMDEST